MTEPDFCRTEPKPKLEGKKLPNRTETAEPTKPTEPAEPTEPTERTKPTEPKKTTEFS